MTEASSPDRHPDDLPPPTSAEAPFRRRRSSGGLRWAVLLALVVLGVMVWVTLTGGSGTDPDRLDASITQPGGGETLVPGQPIPDLVLNDLEGRPVALRSWQGTPMVINFWASWCPPCLREMPAFENVARQREGEVVIVGLNVREDAATARTLADRTGVTYPLLLDADGVAARSFGVVNMPTTVFVTADGTIATGHAGALTADQLDALINQFLIPAAPDGT